MLVTSFGEISKNEYLDPRTAQVAIVDHVKQVSLCPSSLCIAFLNSLIYKHKLIFVSELKLFTNLILTHRLIFNSLS